MALSASTFLNPEALMSPILSIALLVICAGLLVLHFMDIKNTHKRNG
jgi:hypothetical protein